MNQILVTQKLYVTPELKKKKKLYKLEFFLSIFLVCLLCSAYIYAEYDRNKSEQTSQEILENMQMQEIANNNQEDDAKIKMENDMLVVVLNNEEEQGEEEPEQAINIDELNKQQTTNAISNKYTAPNGKNYEMIGKVSIPKINVNYPILAYNSSKDNIDALLKVSITKFWGANPNEVGNLCLVGHNYKNKRFFSKVPTLVKGDTIEITDLSGKTIKYSVYDKFIVDPSDIRSTSQLTDGRKEVTLITCTDDSKQRVIVKGKEIK